MFEEKKWGHFYTNGKIDVVFGNHLLDRNKIKDIFPQYQICSLHQVHGDVCLPANNGVERQADAHYTYDKHLALIIKTADCIPVMCYCETTDTILAIHAGWRGLEKKIVEKSIKKTFPYSDLSKIQIFIGPHIGVKNYEFQKEEIDLFSEYSATSFYEKKDDKYFLNVSAILEAQLDRIGISKTTIHKINIDTYNSPLHYSHRKGCDGKRLLHFIARK